MLNSSHQYVLWYTENPVIIQYRDEYFRMLSDFLRAYVDPDWLTDAFLLIPDVSSTVERMRSDPEYFARWMEILRQIRKECAPLGDRWRYSSAIPGTRTRLTTDDYNPDAHIDTHPDHHTEGVSISFGDIPFSDWTSLYARSFDLLRRASPGFADELDRMIEKIIPLGVSRGKHNSASYSSCIGHLYMSYPTDIERPELAVLEALIHESNHNKLNLIMKTDPLILNDRKEIYYSPYRPDPRHIQGIYLGLHAMVAVFFVFFSMHRDGIISLDAQWLEKSLTYVMKNGLAIRTLDRYTRPTKLGRLIFEEMRTVHVATLAIVRQLWLDPSIRTSAHDRVRTYFSEALRSHPNILH